MKFEMLTMKVFKKDLGQTYMDLYLQSEKVIFPRKPFCAVFQSLPFSFRLLVLVERKVKRVQLPRNDAWRLCCWMLLS